MPTPVSPYAGIRKGEWKTKTVELVRNHPLEPTELVEVTRAAWNDIFASRIGTNALKIGTDLFPKPQIMAFFLHELIPIEFARRYRGQWRGEANASDKDLVCVSNDAYSIEIKASSSKKSIFGNRSYAQVSGRGKKKRKKGKKVKSGYCLAINFEGFRKHLGRRPEIIRIRFGWLDAKDWRGQKASTGQQANLSSAVEAGKLVELFPQCEF